MKREDLEKLLGGYATGTLTDDERRALFDAALTDQTLFDALAGEEALREVLEDPRCRRQIEQALHEQPHGFLERTAGWMRRPRAWALAGTLAATAAIAFVVIHTQQQPRVEIQLAQRQKVEAPAPAPTSPPPPVTSERRMADKPVAPEKKAKTEMPAPAAGGVVGGVLPSQPPALAPAEPPVVAESREADVPPSPVPLAAPPPPVKAAESERAAAADTSKDETSGIAGGPVQLQANRVETPRARSLAAAARQDAPAPALMQVRYDVLVKAPGGQFVEADRRTPVAPGIPVRLVLMPDQEGNLSVFDENVRKLLFSTRAIAGARYIVDPPPADRKFTVVLAPTVSTARTSAPTALRESVEKGKLPGGRIITVIDLTRPRN